MDDRVPLTFYTRPGCHLCETAYEQLQGLARQFPLAITVVDISSDREAHDRWWADIPVIVVGSQVLRAPIDPARLRTVLLEAVRATV